jgi:hypothetical protein
MAQVYLFSKPTELFNVFYTIDEAVGVGRPNRRDDVALVQFFVRRILEGWNDLPPGVGPLMIDGYFGEKTRRYIEHWQQEEDMGPHKWVMKDGVIDAIDDRSGMVTANKAFAMVRLNVGYSDRWGKAWHGNIAIDSLCPVTLLPSIFWA